MSDADAASRTEEPTPRKLQQAREKGEVVKTPDLAAMASLSAAGLKQEMIARLLAEGVKDIFIKIQHDIIRHQEEAFDFEVSPRQWKKIDPTSWRPRSRISPNVGLGSGNREEARANVALLGNMQAQLMQFGLIKPQHAYATFKKGCEVIGFENPSEFATDPSEPGYQPPQTPPDPKVRYQIEMSTDGGTTFNAYITDSRKALAAQPTFWSAPVNDPLCMGEKTTASAQFAPSLSVVPHEF